MRKAERLFQLITILRNNRYAVTAEYLANKLSVSERTIYRDIQALSLSGIPVEGEAGIGYRLRHGFDIPPLMFTENELEALLIGMRMVQAWTDQDMARSASHAMEKVTAVIPDKLEHILNTEHILIPAFHTNSQVALYLSELRDAIKQKTVVGIQYTRADGEKTQRHIQPLGLFYWGAVWTLVAWCKLRNDFRQFRIDRILQLQLESHIFTDEPGKMLQDYLKGMCSNEE